MKKILFQLTFILFIFIIGTASCFITNVNASSIAGLNCPSSVNVGSNFTVALIIPSNAYSAQATIKITFSDGTSSSKNLVYMSGMSDFPNSVSFTASKEGTARVEATGIVISDSSGNAIENGGSKSGSVNIVGASTGGSSSNNNSSDNNNNSNNTSNNSNNNSQVTFSSVNETVYTTATVNVRKSYSTSSDIVGSAIKGTQLKRTGIGSNGWSRVEYNGTTAYILGQYLSTEVQEPDPVEFKDTNEKLYATQNCNLRASWSTSSEKVGYLTEGQEVTRTGYADNGWSRIDYNGQTVYVASRLLTTESPDEVQNEENNENVVENTNQTNEELLANIQAEVGVLPEVGRNISKYIYVIIVISAVIMLFGSMYYIKVNNEKL